MIKAAVRVATLSLVLGTSLGARGDEAVPCADAASQGQRLAKDHRLLDAREQFRQCARRECPLVVKQDCVKWLGEVEQGLPTVVLTATDGTGRDLTDAKVSFDGRDLVSKLDGEAVAVDPGSHSFQFSLADGTHVERTVIIKEGLKNQSVAVVFGASPRASPAAGDAAAAQPAARSRTWTTVGWVSGGAGLLGLAFGAAFGVTAIVDNNDAHCNAMRQCAPGPLGDARTAAVGADIGFIAGGLLLASGVSLVLLTARESRGATAAVSVRPALGPGRSSVVLEARF